MLKFRQHNVKARFLWICGEQRNPDLSHSSEILTFRLPHTVEKNNKFRSTGGTNLASSLTFHVIENATQETGEVFLKFAVCKRV